MGKKVQVSESSGSDSDDEAGVPAKNTLAAFRHYLVPLLITVLAEYWMCHTMMGYINDTHRDAKDMPGNVQDKMFLGSWYMGIFWGCIVARLVVVLLWRVSFLGCADAHYAALFMFFSTFQWVYYLTAYYIVREELTGLQITDTLISESQSADSSSMGVLASCIDQNGTMNCKHLARPVFGCGKVYDPSDCSGFALVGKDDTKCCVQTKYSLQRPHDILDFWVWHPGMDQFFSIIKWVGVLAMKWVLEKNPLMPRAYSPFVQGSVIDILDSIVFAAYLSTNKILYPKYGISLSGDPVPADNWYWRTLVLTVIVAFTTSVLSPCLYIFFRSGNASTEKASRNFGDAVADLAKHLRMLRSRDAHRVVDEALQLQLESYKDVAGASESHAVKVVPAEYRSEDEESPMSALNFMQEQDDWEHGMAVHAGKGMYSVKYKGGKKSEKIDVARLHPDLEKHAFNPLAPGCCKGLCGGLPAGDSNFESRAEIFDAARSLFCLELPFFLWRYFFEIEALDITSFSIIMLLKNFLWGLHDLLVILSCNNPAMTVFGFTPLATLSTMINGSAMSSVGVGPAGFVRVAADVTMISVKSRLEAKKSELEIQKAWLMVEREKVRKEGKLVDEDEGVCRFNAAIAVTEGDITKVVEQLAMAHT